MILLSLQSRTGGSAKLYGYTLDKIVFNVDLSIAIVARRGGNSWVLPWEQAISAHGIVPARVGIPFWVAVGVVNCGSHSGSLMRSGSLVNAHPDCVCVSSTATYLSHDRIILQRDADP